MGAAEELPEGLYDALVDARLRQRIDQLIAEGRRVREERVDPAEQPTRLAQHLQGQVARLLESVPPDRRVEVANGIVAAARQLSAAAQDDLVEVAEGPSLLREVTPSDLDGASRYLQPEIPLGQTDLLVNARGEPALAHELAAEITSADEIDLICAFIKWHGLRLVAEPLEAAIRRGVPVRVLTTTYVGATERRAVDELVRLGAKVRISYETQRTRLHAKAWLFRRRSGLHTAYVGSSNLSRSALIDGLEWNVRISRSANAPVIDKFAATFDSYWASDDFEPYDPDRDGERLDAALGSAHRREPLRLSGIEVRPHPFQEEILEALDAERKVHGRTRNLVVAATGTGKTVVAALDFRRLRQELGGDPTLLFVAHRKEILEQSQLTFAQVLNDGAFGERYVDGSRPERWRHVFASIQSLTAYGPERIPPHHFDVVIVDEFHRAAARTYQRLLDHLQPKILLGLTATPERADGINVADWFDGHIAAELRLWEALERDLLAPFHYFGVADNTDLRGLEWKRGGYDSAQLDQVYTGDDARVRLVLRELERHVTDVHRMRALGFCVSQQHAHFMAARFNDAGIAAVALDANTPSAERDAARRRLQAGELSIIFTVDLFNEGVDLPEVDTVLFLRPTESATVFLQQLGRGLRHAPGKDCLTVLDFIGYQHRQFRFDQRYRALTGGSRSSLIADIEEGFPFLPSGCSLQLDPVARQIVLENVRSQLRTNRPALARELASYGDRSLAEYLDESGRDLAAIYRGSGSWTALRRQAGLPTPEAGPDDDALLKRVHRFAQVDDVERIDAWARWLRDGLPEWESLTVREQRLATMLFFAIWPRGGHESIADGWAHLRRHPAVVAEMLELLAIAREAIRHVPVPLRAPVFADVPLSIHCRYSREELLAGLGRATLERTPASDMEGVRYVEHLDADVFTFTLQKTERHYSPTTLYRDYVMAQDLIHWESQSTTSTTSKTGQRYLTHRERGGHILLFARETEKDDLGTRPFLFLGDADYVSHEGSRPIAIVWRLKTPLPADFFAATRVVAS